MLQRSKMVLTWQDELGEILRKVLPRSRPETMMELTTELSDLIEDEKQLSYQEGRNDEFEGR
jgi:hypothetical protein